MVVLLISTLTIYAQTDSTKEKECLKERPLEVKFEFYPLPLFPSFNNKTVKIETIVNYHNSFLHRGIYGVHFYYDGNTHWKEHNMEDLLTYSEVFTGWKHFQFGLEIGSLSGQEYVAFGPQTTLYDFCKIKDKPVFERFSVISRGYNLEDHIDTLGDSKNHKGFQYLNHYVVGYEYSTHGLPLWHSKKHHVELASTGMGRILLPSYQRVLQASAWFKFVPKTIKKGHPTVSVGLEWENNTALTKSPHEVYFGVEIDL